MRFLMAFVLSAALTVGCGEDGNAGGSGGAGGEGGADGLGGGGGSDPFDTRELDLRDFQRCRIVQMPALSPRGCPVPYRVNPAEIERIGDGEYELTFSSAFSSEEEFWRCHEEAADPDECDYAEPVPGIPRTLGESDLAELMSMFSSVSVNFTPNPCDDISVDQGNIIRLEWDDLAASDLYCENQPWIAFRFASDVLQAVSRLALPPPL